MAAVLPENIADDEEAIAAGRAAYAAAATAIDRLEGFEIWDLEEKCTKRSRSSNRAHVINWLSVQGR